MSRLSGFVAGLNHVRTEAGDVYKIAQNHDWLRDGVIVEFELDDSQNAINLNSFGAAQKYKVPDSFMLSKTNEVRGWQSINKSRYELISPASKSEAAAMASLRRHAMAMGANAVLSYRVKRALFYYTASGIPAQIGQPSELLDDGLIDERDLARLDELSSYIRNRLIFKETFLALIAFFVFALLSMPILFFKDTISSVACYIFLSAGVVFAWALKPRGARLKEVQK